MNSLILWQNLEFLDSVCTPSARELTDTFRFQLEGGWSKIGEFQTDLEMLTGEKIEI